LLEDSYKLQQIGLIHAINADMAAIALEPSWGPSWRDELELQEAEAQRHRAAELFVGSARLDLLSPDPDDDIDISDEDDGS
jgi:hypothetical protein